MPRYSKYIRINELKSQKLIYSWKCPNLINGFITQNDNNPNQTDYLNVLTRDNNIYIYNLKNGNLVKKYDIFDNDKSIGRFIQWNDRYIIFIIDNHLLEILDWKINRIITVIKSIDDLYHIKKINYQAYGESLLISGKDS